ncbi:LuxR C-terminal-related transcriptional regulator [Dyadobacter sp. 676]|uniref:LuxR C-terminal-related transcriptional regulator n=1 Tax=Dyadobacter sp. 676 TaxID=3088362 RepID=A0AAU8FFY1_9BACT
MKIALIATHGLIQFGVAAFARQTVSDVTLTVFESAVEFALKPADERYDLIYIDVSTDTPESISNKLVYVTTYASSEKVIALGIDPGLADMVGYLWTGCHGYVSIHAGEEEMRECLTTVIENRRYISPELLDAILRSGPPASQVSDLSKLLSKRENQIAQLLMQGLKTSQIALEVGTKMSTISTIKRSIFKKLSVDNTLRLKELFYGYRRNIEK